MQVLSHISQRLADMHAAGIVHRNLKPSNVMWLPQQNRWAVVDFGCAAAIGSVSPARYTLAYAAPEFVATCNDLSCNVHQQHQDAMQCNCSPELGRHPEQASAAGSPNGRLAIATGGPYSSERRILAASPASDAWAVGVMAYEMLSGASAFDFVKNGREGVRVCQHCLALGQLHRISLRGKCFSWLVHIQR